jgi:SagB-type dehydrogenase family enzyme
MIDCAPQWTLGWHPQSSLDDSRETVTLYRGLGGLSSVRLPAVVLEHLRHGTLPLSALESRKHSAHNLTRPQAVALKKLHQSGYLVLILRLGDESLVHWQDAKDLDLSVPVSIESLRPLPGTWMRMEGDALVVEAPGVRGSVRSRSRAGQDLLWNLLRSSTPESRDNLSLMVATLLQSAGMLVCKPSGACERGESLDQLAEWHECLFHYKWRLGNHHHPVGAAYPGRADERPPPPLYPQEAELEGISLERWNADQHKGPGFFKVLCTRRSVRTQGIRTLDAVTLGHLLDRVYHPAYTHEMNLDGVSLQMIRRPTIAGGSLHELDLFLNIRWVEGIPEGFYYYAPDRHKLVPIPLDTRYRQVLLEEAVSASRYAGVPSLQMLVVTRLSRLLWKYRSMSYAVTLQNAGALQQTINLVSTALGLGACSIGNGNAKWLSTCPAFQRGDRWWISSLLIGTLDSQKNGIGSDD